MCQRPAWGARHLAKPGLKIMPVNFIDNPINVIGQVQAVLANLRIGGQQSIDSLAFCRQIIDSKPKATQGGEKRPMCWRDLCTCLANRISKKLQVAARGDISIFLAQRSGGGVTRISE